MSVYLIWSEEHGLWWAPNSRGYTASMKRAGRYTAEEAEGIVHNANGGGTFCEVAVEVSDAMQLACQSKSGGR